MLNDSWAGRNPTKGCSADWRRRRYIDYIKHNMESYLKIKKKTKITAFILKSTRKKQPSPHNNFHKLILFCYTFRPPHSANITKKNTN
jgi:hypothetical protein